ncbi:MAG: glucose-6-phosphate dehydrogenase [Candidatus Omnitrophica bacterium]|nr:glucose-6-phosphate dehydrogenase [Candidatus Omnitrophota bacterium]
MADKDFDNPVLQNQFLESCDLPEPEKPIPPFVLVIFGGTGDLSRNKLIPALFQLFISGKLPPRFFVLGLGSRLLSDQEFRVFCRDAVASGAASAEAVEDFGARFGYLAQDLNRAGEPAGLCGRLTQLRAGLDSPDVLFLFYCALPPDLLPAVVRSLDAIPACHDSRVAKIVVEKPFGHDLDSCRVFNGLLRQHFPEQQIYRMDHYLGKDTVQNILFFRFGNSMFEPLWDYRYIDHIQITVAEDAGIENRGRFYEQSGVIRDIVQNHILQLIALVTMEPPVGFEADFIRDETVKVFRTFRPFAPEDFSRRTVLGQYGAGTLLGRPAAAYRAENHVAPDSVTPTFFAGKFYIDNWRWARVPIYVRAGKRLSRRFSEICVQFKQPPLRLFGRVCDAITPGAVRFSLYPEEEISLRMNVKYPGPGNRPYPVSMKFNYGQTFQLKSFSPYQRLLADCLKGDPLLFSRQDGVEAMWAIVDPIVKYWEQNPPGDFPNYAGGAPGPAAADELIRRDGREWV